MRSTYTLALFLTVTKHCAVKPPSTVVAVTTVCPVVTAVTRPLADTVAMLLSATLHVTLLLAASALTAATSCAVCPPERSRRFLDKEREVTLPVGLPGVTSTFVPPPQPVEVESVTSIWAEAIPIFNNIANNDSKYFII